MPHNVSHFDIHADDVDRARKFYETVFGWQFHPWGPPGFWMIQTGTDEDPGIHGALHKRMDPVVGKGMIGYQCTISVDDVEEALAAVEANGGTIVYPPMEIPTVGRLFQFLDTEGNVVSAMRYDEEAGG